MGPPYDDILGFYTMQFGLCNKSTSSSEELLRWMAKLLKDAQDRTRQVETKDRSVDLMLVCCFCLSVPMTGVTQ